MGSPIEGEGIFPMGVQVLGPDSDCFEDPDPTDSDETEVPIFGQYCRLLYHSSEGASGENGFLRLANDGGDSCSANSVGGGAVLRDEIEAGGAQTTCYVAPPGTTSEDCDGPPPDDWPTDYVNYCVFPNTGTFTNPDQDAFADLVESDGECDDEFGDGDGLDQWLEVVEPINGDPDPDPGTTTFARRACDSPRLINLIIIKQFSEVGNPPKPIIAFASFYIDSCIIDDQPADPDCIDQDGGSVGKASLYGFFMNILNIGTLGAMNNYGQRTISLWE